MKCKRKLIVLLGILFGSLMLVGTIGAVTFQAPIDWDVRGSGGSHLEQGDLTLDYTIGQPVVSQISSGNVTLCTGFWCGTSAESRIYLPLILCSTFR